MSTEDQATEDQTAEDETRHDQQSPQASRWVVSDFIDIDATPEEVYELISDVTRTGEWSPTCKRCEWLGEPGQVGSRFKGTNETSERTWETVSQVVAADRPREFAWVVGPDAQPGGFVRWGYRVEPLCGAAGNTAGMRTRLYEDWNFHEAGRAAFFKKWGDQGESEAEKRREAALAGISETLATIRKIAEAGK